MQHIEPRLARALGLLALFIALGTAGCWRAGEREVVVYTALDAEFSQPVLDDFARESGIAVLPKFDNESTKTVGLASAILAEANRPRCDVFWNNEILHTLRLEKAGLLEPYPSKNGATLPATYRSPNGLWYGFAARARVLLVNHELVKEGERPTSVRDLADPKWKGKTALAKPLFGTTATHAAVLFAHWGDERAKEFFHQVKENAQVLSGNKQVAEAVGRGRLAFGLTDTDDAVVEIERGSPVTVVFPDQGEGELGTLLIPNTVAIIRGAPHVEAAQALVEYVLSPAVEAELAASPSAQIPLHPGVKFERKEFSIDGVHWMDVDFAAAAEKWEKAARFLRGEFASAP